jgi:hypothetical protein
MLRWGSHLLEQFVLMAGLGDEIISPALNDFPALVVYGASGQCNNNRPLPTRIREERTTKADTIGL